MATQKVRPDEDRDERQRVQRRQVSRTIKVGTLAFAASAGAIAVLIAIVALGAEDQRAPTAAVTTAAGGGAESTDSPNTAPHRDPFTVGFKGLPPEDATPSGPVHGELVKSESGIHDWFARYLYADGRLIWAKAGADGRLIWAKAGGWTEFGDVTATTWIEQRLAPEGVELLRSSPSLSTAWLPATAWEDRKLKPYVASRYAIVGSANLRRTDTALGARVRDLLRGAKSAVGPGLVVTTEDARALAEMLKDAWFRSSDGDTPLGAVKYVGSVTEGMDIFQHLVLVEIEFRPILPDGRTHDACYGCG